MTANNVINAPYGVVSPWTAVLTAQTPGDLSVSYAVQKAYMVQIGSIYIVSLALTCTPTFTTASGAIRITGFSPTNTNIDQFGSVYLGSFASLGTSPATIALWRQSSTNYFQLLATNVGAGTVLQMSNLTSGVQIQIEASMPFFTTS
jgi:hypothetical protein